MDAGMVSRAVDSELLSFVDSLRGIALDRRQELPVLPEYGSIAEARERLPKRLNEKGREDWVDHLTRVIAPALNASSLSPNYYGFVTGGCTQAALYGDMVASIYDQNVQVHLPDQTIATDVEACALNMLLDLFRLDHSIWGPNPTFTTGATASNVLGLAMGREWVLRRKAEERASLILSVGEHGLHDMMEAAGVQKLQVLSSMPHSSIAKAASLVGVGRANVISISRNDNTTHFTAEIDFDRLEREAKKPGVASIFVVSAGEVNTGRFATNGYDQMRRLRTICDTHGIWLHVDGAFGLFGRLISGGDAAEFGEIFHGCEGLELADSITGDAHKLLNVPYDCGFYFCRHRDIAEAVFRNGNAAYLTSTASEEVPSPLNIGVENSRRFRALPVYATLLAHGREGYIDMLKRQITLARTLVADLWDSREYQVLPTSDSKKEAVEKTFMVVLFRARDDSLNDDLVRRINASRRIYVSGTSWEGKAAARLAIANWGVNVDRDHKIIHTVLQDVAR